VRLSTTGALRFAMVAECSFALSRTHYDVTVGGSAQSIGRPWIASPSIGVELGF
jgi:hypothetical protein